MFIFQMNLKWGCPNPSTKWNSNRFNLKIFSVNPNGFQKCSSFLENARTITRGVAHFSMTYLVTELNHIVFAIGHLNAIYYFKCSINSELKCGLLGIIPTEPTIICRIFGNVLVFLIKPYTYRKIGKTKQNKERERILPGSPLAGPALCWPAPVSCFLPPEQAER